MRTLSIIHYSGLAEIWKVSHNNQAKLWEKKQQNQAPRSYCWWKEIIHQRLAEICFVFSLSLESRIIDNFIFLWRSFQILIILNWGGKCGKTTQKQFRYKNIYISKSILFQIDRKTFYSLSFLHFFVSRIVWDSTIPGALS